MPSAENFARDSKPPDNYIVTDPCVWQMALNALADMGRKPYLSALLFDGPPGCGKTFLAKQLAKKLSADFVQFQFFPGCGRGEMVFDNIGGALSDGILVRAAKLSATRPVVLLLDEIDKADVSVDAFLLNYINDSVLNVPQLGEPLPVNGANILVVITKNDQRKVSHALMRRCRCATMNWPTQPVETAIFQQQIPGIPPGMTESLIGWAAKLRGDSRFSKKPSTPELVRLLEDIAGIIRRAVAAGQQASATELGNYIIGQIAPDEGDRLIWSPNNLHIGSRALETMSDFACGSGGVKVSGA